MALRVAVFDRKGEAGKPCAEHCGVDWTDQENQKLARQNLRQFFGDMVELEFHDAEQAPPDIARGLKEGGLLLPLLVINGRVRLQGFFDFRRLRDMVEAVGEAHG
ncbi:MAG TPA: hypothetical protein VI877_05225 [Dehalococcoidia bacterium]|nr:hypothetical protein [Dehalococcoidia bacterium]